MVDVGSAMMGSNRLVQLTCVQFMFQPNVFQFGNDPSMVQKTQNTRHPVV